MRERKPTIQEIHGQVSVSCVCVCVCGKNKKNNIQLTKEKYSIYSV